MKIRLGYVAISKALDKTTSSTFTYTDFSKNKDYDKLNSIIIQNLSNLIEILQYNIKNNIHFYRLSSKLIPLSTKTDVLFDYINPYKPYYDKIHKIVNDNMRIDFHPDQYCILNSTKKEVIENTRKILIYHYKLLEAMKIKQKLLVIHIGSSVFGKEQSIKRFIKQFNLLPTYIKECIALENDDKIYNAMDCLKLCQQLKIPMVLDYHHHLINPSVEKIETYLDDIWKTWNATPKIHFSSPKNKTKKEYRTHHDYIDINMFINFLNLLKDHPTDLDIMLEAKAKDDALFRLIRQLKYKNYLFIDDTTFII